MVIPLDDPNKQPKQTTKQKPTHRQQQQQTLEDHIRELLPGSH